MKKLRKRIGVYLLVMIMLITSVMPVYAAEPVITTAAEVVVPSPKLDMVSLINYYIENFDVEGYKRKNPDLIPVFGEDIPMYIMHYVLCGISEGRRTGTWDPVAFVCNNADYIWNSILTKGYCEFFDLADYKKKYPNLVEILGDDNAAITMHYLVHGIKEGRTTCAPFDPIKYAQNYPDSVLRTDCKPEAYVYSFRNLDRVAAGPTVVSENPSSGSSNTSSSSSSSSSGSSSGSSGGTETQVETITDFYFTVLDGSTVKMSKPVTSVIKLLNPTSASFEEVWEDQFSEYSVYMDAYAGDKYAACFRVNADDFTVDTENWLATFTATTSMFGKQLKFAEGLDSTVEISFSPDNEPEESMEVGMLQLRYEYADGSNHMDILDREIYNMENEADLDFAEAWDNFFDMDVDIYIDAYADGVLIETKEVTVDSFEVAEAARVATLYLDTFFEQDVKLADGLYKKFILDYATEAEKNNINWVSFVLAKPGELSIYPTMEEMIFENDNSMNFEDLWSSKFADYNVGLGALSRGLIKDTYFISVDDFAVDAENYKATLTIDTSKFTKEGLNFSQDIIDTVIIDYTPSDFENPEDGNDELVYDDMSSNIRSAQFKLKNGDVVKLPETISDLQERGYYFTTGGLSTEVAAGATAEIGMYSGSENINNSHKVLLTVKNFSEEEVTVADCIAYKAYWANGSADSVMVMPGGITLDSTWGEITSIAGAPDKTFGDNAPNLYDPKQWFYLTEDDSENDCILLVYNELESGSGRELESATIKNITISTLTDAQDLYDELIVGGSENNPDVDENGVPRVEASTITIGAVDVSLVTDYNSLITKGFIVDESKHVGITADTLVYPWFYKELYMTHPDISNVVIKVCTETNYTEEPVALSDLDIIDIEVTCEDLSLFEDNVKHRGAGIGNTVDELTNILSNPWELGEYSVTYRYEYVDRSYYVEFNLEGDIVDEICIRASTGATGLPEPVPADKPSFDDVTKFVLENTNLNVPATYDELVSAGFTLEEGEKVITEDTVIADGEKLLLSFVHDDIAGVRLIAQGHKNETGNDISISDYEFYYVSVSYLLNTECEYEGINLMGIQINDDYTDMYNTLGLQHSMSHNCYLYYEYSYTEGDVRLIFDYNDDNNETVITGMTISVEKSEEDSDDNPPVGGDIEADYGLDFEATGEISQIPEDLTIDSLYQMSVGDMDIELPCAYQTLMDMGVTVLDNLVYDADGSEGTAGDDTPLTADTILEAGQYFPSLDSLYNGAEFCVGIVNDSVEDRALRDCTVYGIDVSEHEIANFAYVGIDQSSTLGDVSAKFGAPYSKYDGTTYFSRHYQFTIGIDTESIFATTTEVEVEFVFDENYNITDIDFTTPIVIAATVPEDTEEPADTEVEYTADFDDMCSLVIGDTTVTLPTDYNTLTTAGFTPVSTSSLPAITGDTEVSVGENAYCYFMHEDFTGTGFLVITDYNTTANTVAVKDLSINQIRTVAISGGEADTEDITYSGVSLGDSIEELRTILGEETNLQDSTEEEGYVTLCYQYYRSKESNDNICVEFYCDTETNEVFSIDLYVDITEVSESSEDKLVVSGTEFALDMPIQDLLDAGWVIEESMYSQQNIGAGETAWESLVFSNTAGAELDIVPYNNTETAATVADCVVAGINVVTDWQYAGLTEESTIEEMVNNLGDADTTEAADGGIYYNYSMGGSYTLSIYTVDDKVVSISVAYSDLGDMIMNSWPELSTDMTIDSVECTLSNILDVAAENNWQLLVANALEEDVAAGEEATVLYTFAEDQSETVSLTFKNESLETKQVKDCVLYSAVVKVNDAVVSGVTVGSSKEEVTTALTDKYCAYAGDTSSDTYMLYMSKEVGVNISLIDNVVTSVTIVAKEVGESSDSSTTLLNGYSIEQATNINLNGQTLCVPMTFEEFSNLELVAVTNAIYTEVLTADTLVSSGSTVSGAFEIPGIDGVTLVATSERNTTNLDVSLDKLEIWDISLLFDEASISTREGITILGLQMDSSKEEIISGLNTEGKDSNFSVLQGNESVIFDFEYAEDGTVKTVSLDYTGVATTEEEIKDMYEDAFIRTDNMILQLGMKVSELLSSDWYFDNASDADLVLQAGKATVNTVKLRNSVTRESMLIVPYNSTDDMLDIEDCEVIVFSSGYATMTYRNLQIGSTEAEVREVMGEPTTSEEKSEYDSYEYSYESCAIYMEFTEQVLSYMSVHTKGYEVLMSEE